MFLLEIHKDKQQNCLSVFMLDGFRFPVTLSETEQTRWKSTRRLTALKVGNNTTLYE